MSSSDWIIITIGETKIHVPTHQPVNYYQVGGFNHLEKYEFVNGKDDIPYMMENIKAMFETTNQLPGYVYRSYRNSYRNQHPLPRFRNGSATGGRLQGWIVESPCGERHLYRPEIAAAGRWSQVIIGTDRVWDGIPTEKATWFFEELYIKILIWGSDFWYLFSIKLMSAIVVSANRFEKWESIQYQTHATPNDGSYCHKALWVAKDPAHVLLASIPMVPFHTEYGVPTMWWCPPKISKLVKKHLW